MRFSTSLFAYDLSSNAEQDVSLAKQAAFGALFDLLKHQALNQRSLVRTFHSMILQLIGCKVTSFVYWPAKCVPEVQQGSSICVVSLYAAPCSTLLASSCRMQVFDRAASAQATSAARCCAPGRGVQSTRQLLCNV